MSGSGFPLNTTTGRGGDDTDPGDSSSDGTSGDIKNSATPAKSGAHGELGPGLRREDEEGEDEEGCAAYLII